MYKILIVDDEPIAVQSEEFILQKNFENIDIVGTAYSGKSAVTMALNLQPNIILMDINMPTMNGIDAMKEIRVIDSIVKFIVISATDYSDHMKDYLALDITEFILKPLNSNKLVNAMNKVINYYGDNGK